MKKLEWHPCGTTQGCFHFWTVRMSDESEQLRIEVRGGVCLTEIRASDTCSQANESGVALYSSSQQFLHHVFSEWTISSRAVRFGAGQLTTRISSKDLVNNKS